MQVSTVRISSLKKLVGGRRREFLSGLRSVGNTNEKILYSTATQVEREELIIPAYLGSEKPGKHSYMSIPGEFPLIGKTAGQLFDDTVEKFTDSEALVICQEEQRLTYADLKTEVQIMFKIQNKYTVKR